MTPRFGTPLIVENLPTDERRNARLTSPLVYAARDGRTWTVPAGFRTDLASIPRLAQAAIGKWERHAPAAVLHDWLYETQPFSRRDADWLFAEALFAAGVPTWKRAAMWLAVRAGGGRAWSRNRRRNREAIGGTDMARRMPTFEDLETEYAALWASMEIRADRLPAMSSTARKIIVERHRYEAIEAATGVPWFVVGVIHAMECGLRFDRHLHNGDPLTRRTVQVPAGRPANGNGPFTFEESACDALLMKKLDTVPRWTLPRIAYELERYNGWGYRLYHPEVASPYLWSGTTHYERGKYVADGKWSTTAVSGQSGALALLKRISELDPSVRLDAPAIDPAAEFVRTPEAAADAPKTMGASTTGNTAIALGTGGGATTANEVSMAMAKVAATGRFSLTDFLLALASSPTFWVGVFTMAGAAYIWLERRRKLVVHGV